MVYDHLFRVLLFQGFNMPLFVLPVQDKITGEDHHQRQDKRSQYEFVTSFHSPCGLLLCLPEHLFFELFITRR